MTMVMKRLADPFEHIPRCLIAISLNSHIFILIYSSLGAIGDVRH